MSGDPKFQMKIRKMILRDFQSGLTAGQASMNIAEKYGVKGFGTRTCQRWFKKFRDGDFNLEDKPTHRKEKLKKKQRETMEQMAMATMNASKAKRLPAREVKVAVVTFRQEQGKTIVRNSNEMVQKLIQRKPEITLSRLNQPTRKTSYRTIVPTSPLLTPLKKQTKTLNSSQPVRSKTNIRPSRVVKAELQLPPSIAKRMIQPQASKEVYNIRASRKSSQKSGESVKKPITVQFQNVNPELVKNTVKKTLDTTPLNPNKRLVVPQSTPLASPKGVIYLNPQEIFRQSFDLQTTTGRQPLRSVRNTPVPPPPAAAPKPAPPAPAPQATVEVIDSDSEDDIVLPENVSFPAPKVKPIVDTFTTYWDMETDKPVLLNPSEEMIASSAVIEID